MQPVWLAQGRKVAAQLGTDVIVFEYNVHTHMRVNGVPRRVSHRQWGIKTVEDFGWWARNFEILHSAVVSPYEGE